LRETFIHKYLEKQHLPNDSSCKECPIKEGLLRCIDCFGQPLFCHSCCLKAHYSLPFHSIEKWTGKFFKKTSLNAEGFTLHLNHGGLPCPANTTLATEPKNAEDRENDGVDEVLLEGWETRDTRALVIVDVSRIHQLKVSWCCCEGAPDHGTQLFNNHLFPASTSRPSTVFTFAVLEYFHVDAVECKTSALNFSNKLRRLTEFTNPQSVPVSKIDFILLIAF
jgi:KDZ transposase family protein